MPIYKGEPKGRANELKKKKEIAASLKGEMGCPGNKKGREKKNIEEIRIALAKERKRD